MIPFFKRMRRFKEDERGYSSAEFVIVATTFLTGFFWIFETGLIMTKQMMLERAVDMTVRQMRLASSPVFTHDKIRDDICDLALIIDNCKNDLLLEMEVVDLTAGFTKDVKCRDKELDITPLTVWTPGLRSEVVYMRACAIIDPMMPNGIALFPGVTATGIPLFADTAFVNEPE